MICFSQMGRIRGPNRTCPECFEQVTGSKCYCSGGYATKKSSKKSSTKDVKIRRTERVKRGRPDYYDILEYERQARREKKQRLKSKCGLNKEPKNDKSNKDIKEDFKSNRMHLKAKKTKKKKFEVVSPKEEELEEIILSKETIAKFDLILQDINRKIYASSWRRYT